MRGYYSRNRAKIDPNRPILSFTWAVGLQMLAVLRCRLLSQTLQHSVG